MKKNSILIAVLLVLAMLNCAFAEEDEQTENPEQLQKIIITPNRFSQKFQNSTGEITIITKEDIENSGSEILLDTFRTIKGVVVRDYYGNGARASVDIRGFGETSGSNALVLVDGRRVNNPDLSGVDWTQIPLERVERIEILNGGTGSVLYGDNAVGGVINIITKSGNTKKPTFELYTSGGSYNMNKQSISLGADTEKVSYSFTTSRFDTNGYRQNSDYSSRDFGTKIKYKINDAIALKLSSDYHDAELGLPGPLNAEQYATLSRRDSTATERDNRVGETDYYIKTGLEGLTFDFGILNLDLSFRSKTSDTFFPNWFPTFINLTSKTKIDTIGITPNYTCTLDILGRPNKVITGIDFYKTDTKVDDFNNIPNTQSNDNDIDKDTLGLYLSDSFDITDKVSVDLGFRHERINYNLNYIDFGPPVSQISSNQNRKEEAFKAGLVYIPNNTTQLYFNASKSFRAPATDEFLFFETVGFTRQIDTGLSTQTALNFDGGIRHAFGQYFSIDLTLFNMNVNNEIFFNPISFKNDTYDKTRHQGINLQADLKLTKHITAFANWIYTRALFLKGTYDKNTIPMVPLNKASAGFNLDFWKSFKVVPMINFVGRRFMISDQANQAGKLDGYFTADLRLSYEKENFEIFFNANNVFNRKYVEYAVTNAAGTAKNYYPSPERNFSAGLKLKF